MSAKPGADSPSEIMSGDHHVMVDGGEISTPRPNYMRNGLNGNIGSALGIRGAEDVHIRPSIPVIFPGHLRKSVLQVQTSPNDWFALIYCIGSSESVRHIKARLQSQSTDGRCCRLSTGCAGGGFGSWGDNVVWVRLDFSPGLGLHPMTGHQNRTRHPDLNFLYWLWRAVFRSRQEMASHHGTSARKNRVRLLRLPVTVTDGDPSSRLRRLGFCRANRVCTPRIATAPASLSGNLNIACSPYPFEREQATKIH